MAIWAIKTPSNQTPEIIGKTIDYILNPEKTGPELIYGHLCAETAKEAHRDWITNKRIHRKTDKRQIIHIILSFCSKEPTDEHEVRRISIEICQELFADYQYLIAVHTNTLHLHSHIVINSVSVKGDKYHLSRGDFMDMRSKVNKILLKNGKNPLQGFEDNDFVDAEFTEEEMSSKDWLELKAEHEELVYTYKNQESTCVVPEFDDFVDESYDSSIDREIEEQIRHDEDREAYFDSIFRALHPNCKELPDDTESIVRSEVHDYLFYLGHIIDN